MAAAATTEQSQELFQELRTASRHAVVYGLGNMLTKALGFVMLPFYTHYLTPRDYGILEILDLSVSLFGMFLTMGMTAAVLRRHASAKTVQGKHAVISSALIFVAITGFVTFGLGLLVYRQASAMIVGPDANPGYLLLSFSSLIVAYVGGVPRAYMRAIESSGMFTIVDNVGLCAILLLNIYFVAFLKIGLAGILLSALLVGFVQTMWLSIWTLKRTGLKFSSPDIVAMLQFGWPLVFSNLALFTLNYADRFFLKHYTTLAVVGVYAVGYKFGFMLNYLIIQPFFVMWQSRMYVVHAKPDYQRVYRTIFMIFSVGLTYVALLLSLASSEAVTVMLPKSFQGSYAIIPIVAFAYVFWGMGYYAQLGMFVGNRTKLVGVIGAFAAVGNVILNALLISRYGMFGAAWATLISFALLAVGTYMMSERVFPLKLGITRGFVAVSIGAFFYCSAAAFHRYSAPVAIAASLVVAVVFPIVIWKLNILEPAEKGIISAALGAVRGRTLKLVGASARP